MKTIWGIVSADGTPASGAGYKVVKDIQKGTYDVLFSVGFKGRPSVVVTQLYPNQTGSAGGDTRDNAVVVSIGVDRCRIVTGQQDGSKVDRDFSFNATGDEAAPTP